MIYRDPAVKLDKVVWVLRYILGVVIVLILELYFTVKLSPLCHHMTDIDVLPTDVGVHGR
jgi:hypothetical protein